MNIATFFKASTQTISKESFKRQHPAPYIYLTIRHGFYALYTSQEPSYALAEAWLKKRNETDSHWGLIQPLEDGRLFSMFVNKGDVIKAQVGTFEQLDSVLLTRCLTVYLVEKKKLIALLDTSQHQGLLHYSVESLEPLTENELAPFALKKVKVVPTKTLIGLLIGALIGMGGFYLFSHEQKKESPPPPIDPYLAYRTAINQAYSIPEMLQKTLSLGTYGLTLPYGWQFKTLSLQDDMVTLAAIRTENGQRPVITAWLNQHEQLKPYSHITLDTLTINIPLQTTLAQWNNKIMATEPSLSSAIDTLVALGWKVTDLTNDNGIVSTTSRWMITKDTTLSELSIFNQIFEKLPVTITQLEIIPNGAIGHFRMQLRFAFIGQQ